MGKNSTTVSSFANTVMTCKERSYTLEKYNIIYKPTILTISLLSKSRSYFPCSSLSCLRVYRCTILSRHQSFTSLLYNVSLLSRSNTNNILGQQLRYQATTYNTGAGQARPTTTTTKYNNSDVSGNNNNISSSPQDDTCVLCDEPYTDWFAHSRKVSHIARETICEVFVSPERHEQMMNQLWEHIRLDFQQIDQLSQKKINRRRTRLGSTLEYITEQGVLRHSIPNITFPNTTSLDNNNNNTIGIGPESTTVCRQHNASTGGLLDKCASAEKAVVVINNPVRFSQLVIMGEGYLMAEGIDRLGRLIPRISGDALMNLADYVTSPIHLRSLFEAVHLEKLIMTAAKFTTNHSKQTINTAANSANDVHVVHRSHDVNKTINDSDSQSNYNCKNEENTNSVSTVSGDSSNTDHNIKPAKKDTINTDIPINNKTTASHTFPLDCRSPPIAPNEKVVILLAILGELRYYISQKENLRHAPLIPPTPNTGGPLQAVTGASQSKSSFNTTFLSEQLVLNVLAAHCSENLVSELIHGVLQQIVDESTPVWNEYKASVPNKILKSGLYCTAMQRCGGGIGIGIYHGGVSENSCSGSSSRSNCGGGFECNGKESSVKSMVTNTKTLLSLSAAPTTLLKGTMGEHHNNCCFATSATVDDSSSRSDILLDGVGNGPSCSPFFTDPLGLLTTDENNNNNNNSSVVPSVQQYLEALSSDAAPLAVTAHKLNVSHLANEITQQTPLNVMGRNSNNSNSNSQHGGRGWSTGMNSQQEYLVPTMMPKLSPRPLQ